MVNSAAKIDFRPRTNLARTLEYRPHIRWMYRAYMMSAFFLLALSVLVALDVTVTRGVSAALPIFVLDLSLPAIFYVSGYFLLRPLAFTKVTVNSDELTIEKLGKTHTLKYDEIRSVRLRYIPYFMGQFSLITTSGGKFHFTAVLERSDYILETVYSFNPQLISLKQIENYRRTGISIDHSWGRFYSALCEWPTTAFKYAAFPMILTAILFSIPSALAKLDVAKMFWVFLDIASVNALIGLAVWTLSEVFFIIKGRSRIIADPNNSIRSATDEARVLKAFSFAHYVLAIACLIGLLL